MTKVKFVDYSRALAISIVVIGHMIEMTNVGDLKWKIDTLCYLLHVPTFLIISGYLFSKSSRRYEPKEIIISKSKRLLFPYVLWTFILALYSVLLNGMSFEDAFRYAYNALWYFAFLWACIIGTSVLMMLHCFKLNILMVGISIGGVIGTIYNSTVAKICIHYLIFLIGFYLLEHIVAFKYKYFLIMLFVFCFLFCVSTGYLSLFDALNTGFKTFYVFMLKILGACFLPICFSYLEKRKMMSTMIKLGGNTIYIYILHFFIIAIYKNINNDSWIVFIMSVVIVMVITNLLAEIFKKNRYLNKLFTIK